MNVPGDERREGQCINKARVADAAAALRGNRNERIDGLVKPDRASDRIKDVGLPRNWPDRH